MGIAEDRRTSSSTPEGNRKKGGNRFKHQNKNKKTSTTVAPIVYQQQDPVNRLEKNTAYFRLCVTRDLQAENCHVITLQVSLTLLPRHENNKNNILYKINWSLHHRRSPYYRDPINSSYRSPTKAKVTKRISDTATL